MKLLNASSPRLITFYMMSALLLVRCDGTYIGKTTSPSSAVTKTTVPFLSPTIDGLATLTPDNASPLPTKVSEVQQHCFRSEGIPYVIETEPTSVFFVSAFDENQNYFWDFEDSIATSIPFSRSDYEVYGGKISPNRQWIAFEVNKLDNNGDVIDRKLVILNAFGQTKVSVPWKENWGVLRGWLDDKYLFIESREPILGTIIIVDPFTGQTRDLVPTLTNIYDDYPPAIWSTSPNSDLTLVLYPNSASFEESLGYTLWDAGSKKKLWRQASRFAPSVPPQWSSDYMYFVVIVAMDPVQDNSEIFVFDNLGRLISYTDFGAKYSSVFISKYISWSPDGHYLASWLYLGNDNIQPKRPSLVVIDFVEGKATDYCLLSFGIGSDIIWSKDGKWLIARSDDVRSNVLVDVTENKAYRISIPVDGIISGWMTKSTP